MSAFLLTILLLAAVVAAPDDWLGFRGTNGTGVAETTGLPQEFGLSKNAIWKTAVPFGRSSPIVAGDRVFLTASEGDKLVTLALDRKTGLLLWRRDVQRARQMAMYRRNDPASPSPASDGANVYVFFAELGLISYTADGKERWRLPLGPFTSFYGMASSPVIAGDTLVLVCDQQRDSFIIAVDSRSGSVRWKKSRSNPVEAYSTPVIHRPSGRAPQVIVFGSLVLDAYALDTGERIWWVRQVGASPVGTPALGADMVYVSAQGAEQSFLPPFDESLKEYDKDKDGSLQREELRSHAEAYDHFGWMDRDADGAIERAEYDFVRSTTTAGHGLVGIRLDGATGDITASHTAWRVPKQFPYMASPLLYDGVLYTVKDGGIVMSLNPKTGEVLKTGRLEGALEPYPSSPVAADRKVYMTSASGKISVLRAGPQWDVLAVNDLGEECWATPAIAGGAIFVRTRSAIYAFGSAKPGS